MKENNRRFIRILYVYSTLLHVAMKKCMECNEVLEGRTDKKFCNSYCKSAYHHKINRQNGSDLFITIDRQLKINRKILKSYNKGGKATVRKQELVKDGFNPTYFTHYWKATNGNIYLFCYEYGFMEIREHDIPKYVLVQWQEYMNAGKKG